MGHKGLNITLGVLAAACLCVVSGFFMEWKHVSFVAGAFTAEIYLISASFNGIAMGLLKLSKHARLTDADVTGNLTKVRDVFCGIPYSPLCASLCDKFTLDLAAGIITASLFVIAVILIMIAAIYLVYHGHWQTKREYRLVAYRCLCCAPVLVLLGIMSQAVSLFFTLIMSTRIALHDFPSVVTPGGGYFMSIFGFFLLCFAPCLSEQWTLATREVLDDERRQYKRGQKAVLFGDNYSGDDEEHGRLRKDSRAFYKPSNYGSCANLSEPNNQNDPPLYPSLHQPPNASRCAGTEGGYREKNGEFPQDFDFFFSNANNKNHEESYEDHPCEDASAPPRIQAQVNDDLDCPPGFTPTDLPPPPGYENPEHHQQEAIPRTSACQL